MLHTERLVLSRYTCEDEGAFVALFRDERVSRWMGDGPAPEAEYRALFHRVFDVYAENRFDVWGVRQGPELIGHAEIKPTEVSGGYEIIYALAYSSWNQGLGTELVRVLAGYGFDRHGLGAVHATVAESNVASLSLLARLGFQRVKEISEQDGSVTVLLTLHRRDWPFPVEGHRSAGEVTPAPPGSRAP